ncbi:MAG: biopolymer transporter ExbD [Verrucomicrobiales bacterium]|jgi:biopolymer transport protein ExbD|nr:biopolymer transporter ExbD [Verrucomicrobiales bacterium]
MPVKLGSRLPPESEARIEIIPLIDIMFFLLAAFMLVSLSMVNLRSVKVNLPTATAGAPESRSDFLSLTVDGTGMFYLERLPVGPGELAVALAEWRRTNAAVRVILSGDREARHGDVVRALDIVRSCGIDRVAFEIRDGTASTEELP